MTRTLDELYLAAGRDKPVPKKPRMPKNVAPSHRSQNSETDDDAIITDESSPVTRITSSKSAAEKLEKSHRAEASSPAQDEAPAPRSKMRERLLASAKRKKKKPGNSQRIADEAWQRDDRATTFEDNPEPARTFSGRTVALLAVLFIAALIMAQPLQLLLDQQSEFAQAQQQLEHETQRQQELKTQLDRWDDPAYVQQQARERFNMVMPGEHKYLVIDDEEDTLEESKSSTAPLEEETEMGWADRLWGSVLSSGQG